MKNKVNISEILKRYPKGFKFYSALHGKEVELEGVGDTVVSFNKIDDEKGIRQCVNQYGELYGGGECVIFPSKENRDWTTLFVKNNFVVGEIIQYKDNSEDNRQFIIFSIEDDVYTLQPIYSDEILIIDSNEIKKMDYASSTFDYYMLQPFDKVLCRDYNDEVWKIEFFSKFKPYGKCFPFICMNNSYKQCIPYKNNQHLLDTTQDSDPFYYKIFKKKDYLSIVDIKN